MASLNNVGLLAGGYGTPCDFWSLTIIAYEMTYGETPFGRETMKRKIASKITKFKLKLPSSKM